MNTKPQTSAEELLEIAHLAKREKRDGDARAAWLELLEVQPGNWEALLNVAEGLYKKGEYTQAEDYIQKALSAVSDNKDDQVVTNIFAARIARQLGRWQASLDYLSAAHASDPANKFSAVDEKKTKRAWAKHLRESARQARAAGDVATALASFKEAVIVEPDNADIFVEQVKYYFDCYRKEPEYQASARAFLKDLDARLEEFPQLSELYLRFLSEEGLDREVVQLAKHLLNEDLGNISIFNLFLVSSRRLGTYGAISPYLAKATATHEKSLKLFLIAAEVAISEERTDKAMGYLSKAKELPCGEPATLLEFINLLFTVGDIEACLTRTEHYLSLTPGCPKGLFLKGRCLERKGLQEEALELFQEILRIEPEHVAARIRVARALQSQYGQAYCEYLFEEAKELLQKRDLAKVALAVGMFDAVEELLKESISIDADDETLKEELFDFYMSFGYAGKAFSVTPAQEEGKKKIVSLLEDREPLLLPERLYDKAVSLCSNQRMYEPVRGNIAMVIHSLGPGGAERQCATLAAGLSKEHSVRMLCRTLSRTEKDSFNLGIVKGTSTEVVEYFQAEAEDILDHVPEEFRQLIALIEPDSRRSVILQLVREILDYKPEVLHCWLDETIYVAALAGAITGVPKIVGRWGNLPPPQIPYWSESDRERKRCFLDGYKALAQLPNIKFSANSAVTAIEYEKWIGIEGVEVVHNGYDFSVRETAPSAREAVRAEQGIPQDAFVVGGVFHITEKKRPFLWLDVAFEIVSKFPDAYFMLVGGGPMEEECLSRIREQGVEDRIKLVGRRKNIFDYYAAMDLFLLTSMSEGLPNVAIEAQSVGVPVILSDAGGSKEAVKTEVTGFVVASDEALKFSERIAWVKSNPEWLEAAQRESKSFAREEFGLQRFIEKTLSVYGIG